MSTVASATSSAERSAALDGLRGWAAVAVVFYHTILVRPDLVGDVLHRGVQAQDTVHGVLTKLTLTALNGELAVDIFFVISGIVLFRALGAMSRSSGSALGISWRFLLRRVLRIWPAMAVCLIAKTVLFQQLDLAWPGWVQAPTAQDLLDNLLLLRFPVHGATWTLSAELGAAPLLLLCWFGYRRFGPWIVLAFAGGALLAYFKDHVLLRSLSLVGGFPFLMAGVGVECGWMAPLMRSRLRGPVAILALAILVADLLFVPYTSFKIRAFGLLIPVPILVGWVCAVHDGLAGRVLQAPVSRYLGRISFSLYLWNVPVFELLLSGLGDLPRADPLGMGLLVGLAAVLATVPIAHVSERWLEQPCIRLGRALTRDAALAPGTGARTEAEPAKA